MLAVQYYRPPTPAPETWREDLTQIATDGFDAIQLWVVWGWVESVEGTFRYDDYDEIISIASEVGLRVILSTIAEIHPFWLPRVLPDAMVVDHLGRRTPSSLRGECLVGLTPGGCFDHPEVEARMREFLRRTAAHFAGVETVIAWDCWNETRWAVEGDGYLCHCAESERTFREWLREEYGDLDALSAAWGRRYSDWADVHPGKRPGLPYTDLMEHQRFLEWRATRHVALRRDALREGGVRTPILAHSGEPSIGFKGFDFEQALARGNDFRLAEQLDGYGCSHFPVGHGLGDVDLAWRIESTRSTVGAGGEAWVSELQAGSARNGIEVQAPVTAADQQRWIWSALSRGVRRIIFWQWRDEVFGRESGGYGMNGDDGHAAERRAAIRDTAALIDRHRALWDEYEPEQPRVHVLFEPDGYRLDWAQHGADAEQAHRSLIGWLRALEEAHVPYSVIESEDLARLEEAQLVIAPWPLCVRAETVQRLDRWARAGGTLIVESDLSAVDRRGFYTPPASRPSLKMLGLTSRGRRPLSGQGVEVTAPGGSVHVLESHGWSEVLTDIADAAGNGTSAVTRAHGAGTVVAIGTFVGLAAEEDARAALVKFARAAAVDAGALSTIAEVVAVEDEDATRFLWRAGASGARHVVVITGEPEALVEVRLRERDPRDADVVIGGRHARPAAERAVSVRLDGHGVGLVVA
jgi:beta-galactosidase